MLEAHLTRTDVEQYVIGAMHPEAAAKLEAHTLVCDPCAGLLREEALLEEQLYEVAASAPREAEVVRPARWRRMAASAVGPALAAAAAVGFLMLHPQPPPGTRPAAHPAVVEEDIPLDMPRVVACPDVATQESCAESAAERGLMVQYPSGVAEVPRYEGYAGLPPGARSATGPAPL
jgi:hypothetical protein